MVHSNGTRSESHRFRIDFTGSRKYCGRSSDFLRLSAGGEVAARRAMPTSGTAASRAWLSAQLTAVRGVACPDPVGVSGGQSAVGQPELLLSRPAAAGDATASPLGSPALGVGLVASGLTGKSVAAVGRTGRRRIPMRGAVWERTGDIAHLEAPAHCFAFSSPCQAPFSPCLPGARHFVRSEKSLFDSSSCSGCGTCPDPVGTPTSRPFVPPASLPVLLFGGTGILASGPSIVDLATPTKYLRPIRVPTFAL